MEEDKKRWSLIAVIQILVFLSIIAVPIATLLPGDGKKLPDFDNNGVLSLADLEACASALNTEGVAAESSWCGTISTAEELGELYEELAGRSLCIASHFEKGKKPPVPEDYDRAVEAALTEKGGRLHLRKRQGSLRGRFRSGGNAMLVCRSGRYDAEFGVEISALKKVRKKRLGAFRRGKRVFLRTASRTKGKKRSTAQFVFHFKGESSTGLSLKPLRTAPGLGLFQVAVRRGQTLQVPVVPVPELKEMIPDLIPGHITHLGFIDPADPNLFAAASSSAQGEGESGTGELPHFPSGAGEIITLPSPEPWPSPPPTPEGTPTPTPTPYPTLSECCMTCPFTPVELDLRYEISYREGNEGAALVDFLRALLDDDELYNKFKGFAECTYPEGWSDSLPDCCEATKPEFNGPYVYELGSGPDHQDDCKLFVDGEEVSNSLARQVTKNYHFSFGALNFLPLLNAEEPKTEEELQALMRRLRSVLRNVRSNINEGIRDLYDEIKESVRCECKNGNNTPRIFLVEPGVLTKPQTTTDYITILGERVPTTIHVRGSITVSVICQGADNAGKFKFELVGSKAARCKEGM